MFTCQGCKNSIGPKVSPVRVIVETRPKTYYGPDPEDPDKIIIVGAGSEIVKEKVLCHGCAGVPTPRTPEAPDLRMICALANKLFDAAQEGVDCSAWFAQLPPGVLSIVLEEPHYRHARVRKAA